MVRGKHGRSIIMANQQTLAVGRKPTHRLNRVVGEGKAAIWTAIGADFGLTGQALR
jgi:hypothetical protein